jgi:hypothetical protein
MRICGLLADSARTPCGFVESARSPQGQVGDCKVQIAARLKKTDMKPLTVEDELKATIKKLETTKAALKASRTALGRQKSLQGDLMSTLAKLESSQERHQGLYRVLCNERRKAQRATHTKLLESAEADSARGDAIKAIALLDVANSKNKHLKNELSSLLERCAIEGQNTKLKIKTLEVTLAETRHKARIYARQNDHIPHMTNTAVKRRSLHSPWYSDRTPIGLLGLLGLS